MYLEGAAKKWYTQEVKPQLATIKWTALVSEMRNIFLPSDYMTCLRDDLRNRRQLRSESVSSYIVDIRDLCANVNPDMNEKEIFDFLFAGLLPQLKSKILEWEPVTIKKFIECAKKAERSQGISNDHSSSNSDVTATQVQLEQLTDLVKILQLDLQRNKPEPDESFLTRSGSIKERTVDSRPVCWRCNRPGHQQSNCRVNRSFRSYPSQYQQDSQSYDHSPNIAPTNQPLFTINTDRQLINRSSITNINANNHQILSCFFDALTITIEKIQITGVFSHTYTLVGSSQLPCIYRICLFLG
ncbi:uncharacterized protein LOC112538561 [Tetranychus urticae]|uniref:uncharacterized protein LOC112538561 n=1 Tax=Tetranychus urticae TaxID=32264 RepID=UPI000D649976|nr:uncharacterized protein LOC112538561 [Tetranychus urticae]